MARTILLDVISYIFYGWGGDITYWRTRVVLGKCEQGKVSGRRSNALFLSYCENAPLTQLTRLGPLRACPKFEGFSGAGVVVEMT